MFDCCDSNSSKEISRPQYECPSRATPKDLIARGLADSGGETGPLCQDDGKKRTAKGRRLGTLAQTMAVLTSATDQLIGDAPVSESEISCKELTKHRVLTSDIYGAETIKPRKTEYTSHEGTGVQLALSVSDKRSGSLTKHQHRKGGPAVICVLASFAV